MDGWIKFKLRLGQDKVMVIVLYVLVTFEKGYFWVT